MGTDTSNGAEVSHELASPTQFEEMIAELQTATNEQRVVLAQKAKFCAKRAAAKDEYRRLQHQVMLETDKQANTGETKPGPLLVGLTSTLDKLRAELISIEARCIGISEVNLQQRWRFQLSAAMTGDPESAMDYLLTPAIDPAQGFGDDSALRTYRESAQALLERQMQDGNLDAYEAYVRAGYDAIMNRELRHHPALSHAITVDPTRLLAIDLALSRAAVPGFGVNQDFISLRDQMLDPVQVLNANVLADQLQQSIIKAKANRFRE